MILANDATKMNRKEFCQLDDGTQTWLFSISNGVMSAEISDFGGIIYSLKVPNKNGTLTDVVLGCKDPETYKKKVLYFASIIGRCANRIKDGKFTLDNKVYELAKNDKGLHALHGDSEFSHNLWQVDSYSANSITLSYFSPAMKYGYPANVWVKVTYSITEDNSFVIDYRAKSDGKTLINLTNHAYFNLNGEGDILEHDFMLRSNFITETDSELIPTGKLSPVDNTLYDFRKAKKFGEVLPKLVSRNGLDDNFVLDKSDESLPAAVAYSEKSGIEMSFFTTDVGVQIFTANRYKIPLVLKNGEVVPIWGGFCLESQHFPDSINHENFPSVILKRDQVYHQTSRFEFKVK